MAGRALRAVARVLRGTDDVPRTDDARPYRCLKCEAEFDLRYHVCPECGSYSVEREW
jgi:rRNA maturation endonuclease Nob1